MRSFLSLCFAVAAVVVACAGADVPDGVESFEAGVPPYFTASDRAGLTTSKLHYLHGEHSLRWDWRAGDTLVIGHGIGDPSRTGGFLNRAAFIVCLYNKAPVEGALRFAFYAGEVETGSFDFPLQFSGWQPARLFYDTFPNGKPTAAVDRIRIEAPANTPAGTLFFDLIRYNALIYYSASINPQAQMNRPLPGPDASRFPRDAQPSPAALEALQRLSGGGAGGARRGVPEARVADLLRQVEACGVVRDSDGVRGPALVRSSFYYANPGEFGGKDVKSWPDEQGPDGIELDLPSADALVRLADNLAAAWLDCLDEAQRQNLMAGFMLLSDHLYDQGFSLSFDTIRRLRPFPELADLLNAHLARQIFSLGAERFFVPEGQPVMANMDFYASSGPYRLRNMFNLCLAQPGAVEQIRWLNAWKTLFERSLLQPGAPFKPDGSGYHHGGHYPSYAQNALARLPLLLQEIKGTPWFPSAAAMERVRRGLMAQRFYHNLTYKPIALAGRSPFAGGIFDGLLKGFGDQAFADFAKLSVADGQEGVDRELAAAYLLLAPEGRDAKAFLQSGIVAESPPVGTFVMPYAALLCHRRDDWLVSVKGQSCYVWGSERQARRNAYGLFMGLGSLEVMTGESARTAGGGRSGKGWDWGRFEGVTAPRLPPAALDQGWSFVSGTVRSGEAFVGGVAHQGTNGAFAMRLNQGVAPDGHWLQGRKSWFFEGDTVVGLGSELAYGDTRYPLQTTLCQKPLAADAAGVFAATLIDGQPLAAMPAEQRPDVAAAHWFLDPQGTGYYLPAGQSLALARAVQVNRNVDDNADADGVFFTAWLDHGAAPANGSYEYALKLGAAAAAMATFAARPPYHVYQKDASAHIVLFASGRWGCVIFAPGEISPFGVGGGSILPLASASRACLVMVEPERDGMLEMTIADPDLNLVDNVSLGRKLTLQVRGHWKLLEAAGRLCAWPVKDEPDAVSVSHYNDGLTTLEVTCRNGASYGIKLKR